MVDFIIEEVHKHGGQVKVVPVSRIADIRQDLEDLKRRNTLNGFQNYIVSDMFRLSLPDVGFEIRSILAVASPTPALSRITFNRAGKSIPLLLPSGYIFKESVPVVVEGYLNDALAPKGYHVKYAPSLPHKLLAVRSGLTRYGRNNISYADGMGSFLVLAIYYSDIPCGEHEWQEIRQMDLCRTCKACFNACPTGAIREDRFLINNEKCLTFLNEGGGEYPFPDWVPASAHNCIYGCHKCQTVCPMDRDYVEYVVDAEEFTEDETLALLEGRPREQFSKELMHKLENLNMMDYLGVLPRNLKILF